MKEYGIKVPDMVINSVQAIDFASQIILSEQGLNDAQYTINEEGELLKDVGGRLTMVRQATDLDKAVFIVISHLYAVSAEYKDKLSGSADSVPESDTSSDTEVE